MKIGGFQKVSFIDWDKYISCVVFVQGCNFRCKYCHNPELVYPELFKETIDAYEIFEYLLKRKNLLEAVVISGGEPTIYGVTLIDFIKEIRKLGYKVKIYTNASIPEVCEKIIPYIDSISLDIKAPLDEKEKYSNICGIENIDLEKIKNSIKLVVESGIEFEIRTTLNCFINEKDISSIKKFFKDQYNLEDFDYKIQNMNKHFLKTTKE
ncbi:MAG: anaerobic ribonucleoside-triphosphate reductase activating protein [Endomicrobia bacterium]|nr:anaerobic ribonucleoside-triphosphate reductase activating protein [Endomicrobiia bacterium]